MFNVENIMPLSESDIKEFRAISEFVSGFGVKKKRQLYHEMRKGFEEGTASIDTFMTEAGLTFGVITTHLVLIGHV